MANEYDLDDDEISEEEDLDEVSEDELEEEEDEEEPEDEVDEEAEVIADQREKIVEIITDETIVPKYEIDLSKEKKKKQVKRAEKLAAINNIKSSIQLVISLTKKVTSDMVSKYEMTQIIGLRAADIEHTGRTFIDPKEFGFTDSLSIAEKEIRMRLVPYTIRRTMSIVGATTYVEDWDIRQMLLP